MYVSLSFSLWHKESVGLLLTTLIVGGRSISFRFDKAWGRSTSSAAHPAHPAPTSTVPGGWCFPRPPATRLLLCQARHVTEAAHVLVAPPPSSTPILCRPVSPVRLRTPRNKLGTLVMFLLASQPATPNDYLGGTHMDTSTRSTHMEAYLCN